MGIIINNSGKFEDLVLTSAKRQAYRHRDRDIIQTCYSIVFLTTSGQEEHVISACLTYNWAWRQGLSRSPRLDIAPLRGGVP